MSISSTSPPESSLGQLPPATPAYIFRGHTSSLHALHFFATNRYLASADADGWIIVWSLMTRRAQAVWKAHEGSILGVRSWGDERLITHGRDHTLRVWQLKESGYGSLDATLPAARTEGHPSKDPWLLHSMPVNALNFCAFSMFELDQPKFSLPAEVPRTSLLEDGLNEILVGCPNALDSGGIDIFHLPSERRITVLKSDPVVKTGMVMTINLLADRQSGLLTIVSGYEDGHVMLHRLQKPQEGGSWQWQRTYLNRPHTQPVLSLDVSPGRDFFISSSADAILVKHPIPTGETKGGMAIPIATQNTKHAGQQGLTIRDDGKILATAGWDGRVRVYTPSLHELAVLKWHKEGCYCVAFAGLPTPTTSSPRATEDASSQPAASGLALIKQQRAARAQQTHWLAAGGKDGKTSLWDIY